MDNTIRELRDHYGSNSPDVAEQLNSIASELQLRGDTRTALKFHQEALQILEWNKCNALLYDFVKKSKGYALEMALTLRKIGNIFREMNNFVGAAEVYKECLDTFLEALIDGGGGLKRRLLQCEYKKDKSSYHAVLHQVDRKAIGRILCLNPEFRATVREIAQLFHEMQCVKFVGQNAASSRRRRRMVQYAAMEANLKNAVESLSMETSPTAESPGSSNDEVDLHQDHKLTRTLSSSEVTGGTSDSETWLKRFWEKEVGRFSRPRPLSRRSVTSEEECDHYKRLSEMIIPAEDSLVTALKRFPLPASVVGDNKFLRQYSSESARSTDSPVPPPPDTSMAHLKVDNPSPVCVSRPFIEDSIGLGRLRSCPDGR